MTDDKINLSTKYKNYFQFNEKILKWFGLWVPLKLKGTKYYLRLFVNFIYIFYAMIFFTIAEFLAFNETSEHLDDLIKNLNMSLSFTLTITKICVWFAKRSTILKIMRNLIETTDIFEKINDFDPDVILKEEMRFSYKLTMLFFVLSCAVPSSACIGSFYTILFDYTDKYKIFMDVNNKTSVLYGQKLPYYSWVPFNHDKSRFNYGLAVIYQCLALLLCGSMTVGFDMLYTAIVNLLSVHLKLLNGAFKTLRIQCVQKLNMKRCEFLHDPRELSEEIDKEFVRYTKHLQNILKISERVEDIFTYLILQQVLISLVVFCTCLYLVSSIPFGIKFVFELTYLLAIETQLAMYCLIGNKVTTSAEGIPLSIYEGDWLSSNVGFKRNMLITMIRLQKPIYLTIGKFSPLTLTTFVTIGRGSYSLLAMLKSQQ